MDAVHVRRLAIRCRIHSSEQAERARAQRVFQDDIARALDAAVEQAGVGPDEQICIRKLQLSARLWMGLTDEALQRAWAEALAAEIRRAVAGADTAHVVRYASHTIGVLDALRSIAHGDLSREWAWRQLGLVAAIAPGGRRAETICDLLVAEAGAIVPALRAFAGETQFWRLLASLDGDQLARIADAALTAAGVTVTIDAIVGGDADCAAAVISRASLVARRARIARIAGEQQSPARSCAIAVLAILDVEPSLLRGGTSAMRDAAAAVARAMAADRAASSLRTATGGQQPSSSRQLTPDTPTTFDDAHATRTAGPRDLPPATRGDAWPGTDHAGPAPAVDGDRAPGEAHPSTPDRARAGAPASEPARPDLDSATGASPRAESAGAPSSTKQPRDYREQARSEWAGLLLLINVLRDDGLIDQLLDDPALAGRSGAWVLHRLALLLVPAEPSDPAVLAFAGLAPTRLPPQWLDQPPGEGERLALLRHVRACVVRTCERLGVAAAEDTLYCVCARPGEIVADPGWVEVRFPLGTIAVDLRRAGLDLDPGYVPWLGLVMKFAYV